MSVSSSSGAKSDEHTQPGRPIGLACSLVGAAFWDGIKLLARTVWRRAHQRAEVVPAGDRAIPRYRSLGDGWECDLTVGFTGTAHGTVSAA